MIKVLEVVMASLDSIIISILLLILQIYIIISKIINISEV